MTDRRRSVRHISANIIETAMGVTEQRIVVIKDGTVLESYPFTEEKSMTEWTTGTIIVRLNNNGEPRVCKDEQLLKWLCNLPARKTADTPIKRRNLITNELVIKYFIVRTPFRFASSRSSAVGGQLWRAST